jgi:hypothetical protein
MERKSQMFIKDYGEYYEVDKHGNQRWYLHGKQHRENGPAVIFASGSKYWCRHGKLHREDGPAEIWPDGTKFWHFHDRRLSEDVWKLCVESL